MKILSITFLVLLTFTCQAQYKPNWGFVTGLTLAGASHGLNQALTYHQYKFNAKFPNLANKPFWNNQQLWDKTPLILGYRPNAKHILATSTQALCLGSGIVLVIGKKKKLKYYLYDFALGSIGYVVGNYITYDLLFK
jgi:hypothetical protein